VAFILASSLTDQVVRGLSDDTFVGIHQLAWFDWAILIPYFTVLLILSIYGLHRFEVVRMFFKHRKKVPTVAPEQFEQLPRVTVQLPLFNERFVVEQLLEAITKLDYPRELLQVQVLDDSTDETHPVAEALVAQYRAQGFPIEYRHRLNRHGFKAGALQAGLETVTGEFIAIFDADFVPTPDFLKRTIHYFTDPNVGLVQTRWTYQNRNQNLLTEVQAAMLDGHFILEQAARCGGGLFFNFNGTAGVLRRAMIDDAGGWQHDTLVEDADLSYRAQLKGWRFVYVPSIECLSELPVEMHGFQMQQSRWAKGLVQAAIKLLPAILRSKAHWRVKLEAFLHLTPNISYPLIIAMSALLVPMMIVRFYAGWFQMLVVDVPLIIANFWSLWIFYIVAYREVHPTSWKRSIFLMPVLTAAGVALTVINSKTVIEALIGDKGYWTPTPKYSLQGKGAMRGPAQYRFRAGWLPFVEVALGFVYILIAAYAIDTYNFFAVPFLAIFSAGYFWAGFSVLNQEFRSLLRFQRERRLAIVSAR
jgi:cellulose synthase/poly-beta-1,6-N-acetylglucosamine synthase-like glycosyltransferase